MTKEKLRDWLRNNLPFQVVTGTGPTEDTAIYSIILALIENSDKGPEVTRGFVVNSARAMGAAPDALAMVLEEAGVRIIQEKP